ncbi:MAG: hypothetical protein V4749_17900 [Pseudomonadota bacterium]
MTNKTEITKHALFTCLERLKRQVKPKSVTAVTIAELEERLEEYLEDLRKDSAALLAIAGDELRAFQQAARTDREDTVRAVAQADALADQLSEAHRTICSQGSKIQAQQLAIGDLYMRAIF